MNDKDIMKALREAFGRTDIPMIYINEQGDVFDGIDESAKLIGYDPAFDGEAQKVEPPREAKEVPSEIARAVETLIVHVARTLDAAGQFNNPKAVQVFETQAHDGQGTSFGTWSVTVRRTS